MKFLFYLLIIIIVKKVLSNKIHPRFFNIIDDYLPEYLNMTERNRRKKYSAVSLR